MNLKIDEKLRAISKSRSKDNLDKIYYPDVDVSDYFFVSYSHKDYRAVYRDIIKLRQCGLKFWYDRDMPSNSDWKEVANRYMRPLLCKGVIFYISENSLRDYETTKATIDEIKYAKEIGKQIIAINLSSKVSNNGRNKNVVLSASKMVEKLIEGGRLDLVKHKKAIEEIFPENVIYLPVKLNPGIRKERIDASLKEQPKLILNHQNIIGVSDTTIINVTADEFNKMLIDKDVDFTNRTLEVNIDPCVFSNCQSLESIAIKSPLVCVEINSIGEYAFSNCTSLQKIDSDSFMGTHLGTGAFYNCEKLEEYPSTVRITGEKTFYNCQSLKSIDIAKNSNYGDYTFYNCSSLEEVTCEGTELFSYELTSKKNNRIGDYAFYGCTSLKNIALFQCIEEIGKEAFAHCDSFTEISIPKHIKKVDFGAHAYNKSLKKVTILSPEIDIDFSSAFINCKNLEEIVITEENKEFRVIDGAVYKGNTLVFYPWGNKKETLTLDENCTNIERLALDLNPYLKEIRLNKNFSGTSFEFAGLENLERIVVDKDNQTFTSVDGILYSKDLKHLFYIPRKAIQNNEFIMLDSIESFSPTAFTDVYDLEKVKFSNKITEINLRNNSWEKVFLPSSLKFTPFINSPKLKEVYIENSDKFFTSKDHHYLYKKGVREIELSVVSPLVEIVTIQEGVTTISDTAFIHSNAKVISFPDSLKHLGFYTNVKFENLIAVSISKDTEFDFFRFIYCEQNLKHLRYRGTIKEFQDKYATDREELLASGNFEFYDYACQHKTFVIECDDGNLEFKSRKKNDTPTRLLFKNPNKKDDD